jgi:lactate dehydrogenase-like 2-hydroxyacid dehydrogenase
MSSGTDHLDKEALESRGIHYFNIPDLGTDATAEITVALLLAASRRLVEGHQEVVRWQSIFYPISRAILMFSLEIKELFITYDKVELLGKEPGLCGAIWKVSSSQGLP